MKRHNRFIKLSLFFISFTLIGCESKDGINLNILEFPGTLIGSLIDNNSYNSRRKEVEQYSITHYKILREEIKNKKGIHLDNLMKISNIKSPNFSTVKNQLQKDYNTIFHNTQRVTEKLTQTMSHLYWVKEKTKTINGFSYTELSIIINNYVEKNFESIRIGVKNKNLEILNPLIEKLNIKETEKKEAFKESLKGKHFDIYTDLLVVAIMLHGVE